MKNSSSPQSGVALLMSLGILALLSILGIAYSTNMRLMERTSRDFVLEVQARYLAQGGIEYAIAELKKDARSNFVFSAVDTDDTIEPSSGDLPANTSVSVKIIDTARQININNANANLLATLPGIGTTIANNIITKRNEMPNDRFLTKQSVALASGIGEDVFNTIKDYITTDTYIDPNVQDNAGTSQQRSAININTVTDDDNKLLEKILDVVTDVGDATAGTVAAALINNRPIGSWQEFDTIVDNLSISNNAKDNIKSVFNPNRQKPDDNVPTEFCFHSGGTYEITATSTISRNTKTIAQKTINATVKIFDLWNQTTKEQFMAPDYLEDGADGPGDGEINRVTWFDTCPVNSTDKWTLPTITPNENLNYNNSTDYYIIPNALKIGYWDNFSEDIQFSEFEWNDLKAGVNDSTVNNYISMPEWGTVVLNSSNKWLFGNSSITVWEYDVVDLNTKRGIENEGWLWFNRTGWFMFRFYNGLDEYFYQNIDWWKEESEEYIDQIEYQVYAPLKVVDYRNSDPYTQEKIYAVLQVDSDILDLYIDASQPLDGVFERSFSIPLSSNRLNELGYVKFWSKEAACRWDNIRVISDTGSYTSAPSNQAYNSLNLPNPVEWGMVWGTVTRPDSINNPADVDVKIEEPFNNNYYVNFTNGVAIGLSNSSSIQYRLKFYSNYSNTNKYLETPVLEDVWITYLPKTKILYWKEK